MEINIDEIKKLISLLIEKHGDEIKLITNKYGADAINVIAEMFRDEKSGAEKYYDAMQGKTVNELLNEAGEHFIKARQSRVEFKNFLSGVGSIAGEILKNTVIAVIKK